jgi:predicted RNA-binding Zn-ribbon protein involved in translation (DUF1610 family)
LPTADDIVRCLECGGFAVSTSNEHVHYCTRCGVNFTCWCSNEHEMSEQRMCNQCGNQYRRIAEGRNFKNYKSLQRPNRWRR